MLCHLSRHGRRYDVVHTASFPYFSLLAAGAARAGSAATGSSSTGTRCGSREYWREYLGRRRAAIGYRGPAPLRARCASARSASRACTPRRLREEGLRGEVDGARGRVRGPLEPEPPLARRAARRVRRPPDPGEARAGRRSPASRSPPHAIPGLRGVIFGDGPERDAVLAAIAAHGAPELVERAGLRRRRRAARRAARAPLCMVLPSRREGYGLVVVEAAALGTPSVVVRGARQRRRRADRGGRQRLRRRRAEPADARRGDRRASTRRGEALRERTREWFADERRAALARALARDGARELRARVERPPRSSRASAAPCAPR